MYGTCLKKYWYRWIFESFSDICSEEIQEIYENVHPYFFKNMI